MKISELLAKGQIEKAIEVLCDNRKTSTMGIQLSGRYQRLSRQIMLGIISHADDKIERNQIVAAILDTAKDIEDTSTSSYELTTRPIMNNQSKLQTIVSENRRRRPEIANQAQSIINEFRDYHDQKNQNPSYDPSGRRLKGIEEKAKDLIERLSEQKLDSLEEIVQKITDFLSDPVPSYENLNEAYKLAAGRGMSDSYIKNNLELRPADDEVKITIAERIELFVSSITNK